MIHTVACPSPLGAMTLTETDGVITALSLPGETANENLPQSGPTPLLREALNQLDAYFAGRLRVFSLPLAPQGTPFMCRVWQALLTVPYGATASYRDIAALTGNPKAVRAVGAANGRNPIPIIIPCHRIIGSSGKLVGYRGGLNAKQILLELEKRHAPANP